MTKNIATHYQNILIELGENIDREGLKDTPKRAAKALEFLTSGYRTNIYEIINGALFEAKTDEMIIVKNIEFYSLCEHHMLPFIGTCHIGYIPDKKILGLSKFARIVDMFSRRLQVQENMTQDIADALMSVTGAQGVGVVAEAQHMCMMMRGVQKQEPTMTTSVMLGGFRDNSDTRQEFMTFITK